MSIASSPAGPSRHRRKHTAENWDDDFEFALPSRSPRTTVPAHTHPTAESQAVSKSKHLSHASGESKANRQAEDGRNANKSAALSSKAKEVEVEEDWDVGGDWKEGESIPIASQVSPPSSKTNLQIRRGSKGPTHLIIPSNSSSTINKPLGLPRSSSSSASPMAPSPGSSLPLEKAVSSTSSHLTTSRSISGQSVSSPSDLTVNGRDRNLRRHPSSSFATSSSAISSDSQSSLVSWTEFSRSSPNLAPPKSAPLAASSTRGNGRERELRHMKSGDMMPPPPLPSVVRRKSQKGSEGGKVLEVRESQVPFSPSMEQLREMEGKRGFWKRLSSNGSGSRGRSEGSPTAAQIPYSYPNEQRRRRSSSTGSRSPTKIRPNFSPSAQPPMPPVPTSNRSTSAASSASATSSTSQISQAKSTGIIGNLRRSTSSLLRHSPKALEKTNGKPPSSYTPPLPPVSAMSIPIPARSSSRSSQMSYSHTSTFSNDGTARRNSSISKGYHLPSPASGSPYKTQQTGYFDPVQGDQPPLPRSSSMKSAISNRSASGREKRAGGDTISIRSTNTESESGERDMSQVTPKRQKKIRPVSAYPAPQGTGWGGNGWSGFPLTSIPHSSTSPALSLDPSKFPIPPSRSSSHSSSRIPSSNPVVIRPAALDVSEDPEPESSKSFSTLRRLSSLSKKHGRRISGGWKFGTGSSTSTNSSTEEKRNMVRLETVVGSPVKPSRMPNHVQADEADSNWNLSPSPDKTETSRLNDSARGEHGHEADRGVRGGSVSAPNSILKPPPQSARDLNAEWGKLVSSPSAIAIQTGSEHVGRSSAGLSKSDKERRRQSWNDFVIPRNVLEKQKEVRRGIEGVKRFAGGVEALKSLLATHSELSSRLSTSNDLARFSELDREFGQWWEMATVLIEVGSTGQTAPMSPETDIDSPKRIRRVTLASDEARAAADMMRRSQSTPHHPQYTPTAGSSPLPPIGTVSIGDKKDSRKISLPDPQDTNPALLGGGPPRASPDLWRASTGRQDLSKRQLEVLRTMLRTPVSDSSVPSSRNDGMRGMSTISASSTSTSIAERRNEGSEKGIRHVFRPSISRASTSDSRTSQNSVLRFDSPESKKPISLSRGPSRDTPASKKTEMFPSPNDSAYIVPSQSFPSPITASTLAFGVPSRDRQGDANKMRRGSKVGLAGLKEFIKGLKYKESKKDLQALSTSNAQQGPPRFKRPIPPPVATGLPRPTELRNGLTAPLTPTSPTSTPKYPFAWRHRNTPSTTNLNMTSPETFLSTPPAPNSRRTSAVPSIDESIDSPTRTPPARPTVAGPPVSGKERKRPGLRGIFRAGSGSWGDLVKDGDKKNGSRESISIPASAGLPTQRVGSGGSTESAPTARPLRQSSSIDQFGAGMRSTSGPSRLTLPAVPRQPGAENTDFDLPREDDSEMQTLRPQRKSRIMGLGWPEEAAAAREMARLGSDATFASSTSGMSDDARTGLDSVPAGGIKGEEDGMSVCDGEEEITIALTPESLPVLLEYLRQCEGKLGEWRERVKILEQT